MNTPTELLALAARNESGQSSTFAGNKAAALLVNITALDPGATLSITLKASDGTPLVGSPAPIDRPGLWSCAYGVGLGLEKVNAQAGANFSRPAHVKPASGYATLHASELGIASANTDGSGGMASIGNASLPAEYRCDYTIAGGFVTFGVDAVTA